MSGLAMVEVGCKVVEPDKFCVPQSQLNCVDVVAILAKISEPQIMLLITSPHSGETIPPEAPWLAQVDPMTLLTDVDRFVDRLYAPVCARLKLMLITSKYHRYAVDLNREPTDIDGTLVEGATTSLPTSKFVSGFHWSRTTKAVPLLTAPMPLATHKLLVARYYDEFHARVRVAEQTLISAHGLPRFHIDAHSMPSKGTSAHKDDGAARPHIVVSDLEGKSCHAAYKDLVIEAYQQQKFTVTYNDPYKGGRMTQRYGRPAEQRHTVQVELNRALYMDEVTRQPLPEFDEIARKLGLAIEHVVARAPGLSLR